MGAAQERFKVVIRDRWAPALRGLGFKGSGRVFTLPDERDWAMLGFQTSTASTGDAAKFTVNLMVVGKKAWEQAREDHRSYPARPSPNTVGLHRFQQRLGFLTHGSRDWWGLLGDGSNEDEVVTELLLAIRDLAVPVLKAEMADQSPGPRGAFAFRRS